MESNKKVYQCDQCYKTFTKKYNLKRHRETVCNKEDDGTPPAKKIKTIHANDIDGYKEWRQNHLGSALPLKFHQVKSYGSCKNLTCLLDAGDCNTYDSNKLNGACCDNFWTRKAKEDLQDGVNVTLRVFKCRYCNLHCIQGDGIVNHGLLNCFSGVRLDLGFFISI